MSGALASRLTRFAAGRLRDRYPEWAEALIGEQASLSGGREELSWAVGAVRASLVASPPDIYLLALPLAILAMVVYQWSADESLRTLAVLGGLGLGLGFVKPRLFLVSGLAVGAVVAAVNGFEALSGVRPAYEIHAHSFVHSLRWLVLIAPTLAAALMGRQAGLWLQTFKEPPRC